MILRASSRHLRLLCLLLLRKEHDTHLNIAVSGHMACNPGRPTRILLTTARSQALASVWCHEIEDLPAVSAVQILGSLVENHFISSSGQVFTEPVILALLIFCSLLWHSGTAPLTWQFTGLELNATDSTCTRNICPSTTITTCTAGPESPVHRIGKCSETITKNRQT